MTQPATEATPFGNINHYGRIPYKCAASVLADCDFLRVVDSDLATYERCAIYPHDFIMKGTPRKDGQHKGPPGILFSATGQGQLRRSLRLIPTTWGRRGRGWTQRSKNGKIPR